ncbi:HdeD family acid-resistance protein [Gordonia sp. CPCC 205333]|uniref:HdeD family acid-resistance protein n=1 Tax=Gordonia sp. CPCC 205333 TaxID=3140790 RepID=UPI003AF3BFB6
MTFAINVRQYPAELVNMVRTTIIVTSVLGIALGVAILVWPKATLIVAATLFGLSLIATGLLRIYQAAVASFLSIGWRILLGVFGFAILVLGVVALFHPAESLYLLAIFIGVGWLMQGIGELFAIGSGAKHAPIWLLVLSGIISIIAGVVMIAMPGLALATFLWVGAILLIAVSIASLFTLPKKVDENGIAASA